MTEPLRIGIFGTGRAAHAWAGAVAASPEMRLVACASRRPGSGAEFASAHRCAAVEVEQMAAAPDIDAVIVATEPACREPALAAARAGKHILVEKPLAASLPQARALVAACASAGVVGSVVSQRRFDPSWAEMLGQVEGGQIGRPLHAAAFLHKCRSPAYFDEGNGWHRKPEGGVVLNLLIHGIDRMLQLFGPAAAVQAEGHDDEAGICRRAALMIHFVGGATAFLCGATDAERDLGETLTVTGTRGTLELRDEARPAARKSPFALFGRPAAAAAPDSRQAQLADFAAAIRTGRPPAVPLAAGLDALEVGLAALLAMKTGARVSLPLTEA
ncbi:MAG: Gfo/Idh/MocA family protein [Actinomycetota bacterium]